MLRALRFLVFAERVPRGRPALVRDGTGKIAVIAGEPNS